MIVRLTKENIVSDVGLTVMGEVADSDKLVLLCLDQKTLQPCVNVMDKDVAIKVASTLRHFLKY